MSKPLKKKEIAMKIYNRHSNPETKRGIIVAKFVDEADMSVKYASTAFQHIKLGRWV